MKVFHFDNFDTTSAYYRIYIVNNALIKAGVKSAVSGALCINKPDKQKMYADYLLYLGMSDVVVAQGLLNEAMRPLYELVFKLGKPFLLDVDDLLHKLHEGFDKDKQEIRQKQLPFLKEMWSKADGFICSTYELAKYYSEFGKCYVFENCLDVDDKRWNVTRFDSDRIVVGYMGFESHFKDLEILSDVIPAVIQKYGNVDFQFLGYIPDYLKKLMSDRVRFIPTDNDIDTYPIHMAQFDIGLIPLVDNEFNRCKSDLKFLEYSRCGIASIVSQSPVYKSATKDNSIIVRNKPADWIKAIGRLVEDKSLRDRLSGNAFNYICSRDINKNIADYIKILNEAYDYSKRSKGQIKTA